MRNLGLFASARDALLLAAGLLSGCGSLWTGFSMSDPENCVADSSVCAQGQHCNVRLQACEDDVNLFPGPVAPPSYISPGGLATDYAFPRDVHYTLATPLTATIYYTLDGSRPVAGQAGTMSGPSPVALGVVPAGMPVTWFADYGAPYAAEVPHAFLPRLDPALQTAPGAVSENLEFSATKGPAVITVEGGHLALTLSFQAWGSDSCPGCTLQYVLSIPGVGSVLCLDNVQGAGNFPGQPFTIFGSINTPLTPGRYALIGGLTNEPSCDGAVSSGPELGQIFVQ